MKKEKIPMRERIKGCVKVLILTAIIVPILVIYIPIEYYVKLIEIVIEEMNNDKWK